MIPCQDVQLTYDRLMIERRTAQQGINFGRLVAARRKAIPGMTQERLADLVGIPEIDANSISQLEGGRKKYLPEQPLLGAICRALSVSEIEMLRDAGVITEQPSEGDATMLPFPPGDIRAHIVELLKSPRINAQTLLGISQMLEGMVEPE